MSNFDGKILPPNIVADMPLPLVGTVYPPRPNPFPGPDDARTAALRSLQAYLCAIDIQRMGGFNTLTEKREEPETYRIPQASMLIGWPDFEEKLSFPSVVMLSGGKTNNDYPLTPYIDEDSFDVYGKGTVLQVLYEYNEPIILEAWATKKPELRGIMRAFEAMCMPQGAGAIYMKAQNYFDRTARFMFTASQLQENATSAIGRRVGQIFFDLSINVVRLVNATTLTPVVQVIVDTNVETGAVVTDADVDVL